MGGGFLTCPLRTSSSPCSLGSGHGSDAAATQFSSQGSSQGLSMRDAETMMARLVEEGWFDKSAKGFYSLSPRGLMELKGWLVETYNDPADEDGDEPRRDKIKFCKACRDIITVVWQIFFLALSET